MSSTHAVDALQHARREFSQLTQPTHSNNDLTEIAAMPAHQFSGGKDMLGMFQTPAKKHLKPLPGGTDLQYAIVKGTHFYGTIVQIVDPGMPGITRPQVVAVLNLDSSSLPNTMQVGSITVDEDYRGRGLARALYGIVLTIMQKNLVSGSSQTPGGRRNWMSLSAIPGVEVQGLVRIPNQIFDLEQTATVSPQWRKYADRTMDQIMELGGQFYSKDNNSTYWLFDVVPGKGSLQPAVKNALSRLYGYDSDNLLLATWTGA
jgi:GNAT superfamily N-acetyltransferase